MKSVTTIGIDLAKNTFQLHGTDVNGKAVFATTLYLRLVYFPFNVMNFGMGLTGITFRDYFVGIEVSAQE